LLRDPRGRPAGLPLWPGWKGMFGSPDGAGSKKYRRSAIENSRQLQCKPLREREKSRLPRNNGKQWKNNAKNNGNRRKSEAIAYVWLQGRVEGVRAHDVLLRMGGVSAPKRKAPGSTRLRARERQTRISASAKCRKSASANRVIPVYSQCLW